MDKYEVNILSQNLPRSKIYHSVTNKQLQIINIKCLMIDLKDIMSQVTTIQKKKTKVDITKLAFQT